MARVFGDDIVRVSFSRLSAKHRLQAWVELLALTAAHPGRRGGRSPSGRGGRSVLGPVERAPGPAWCWPTWSSCSGPGCASRCPFAPKTSAEYARIRLTSNWPIDPYLKNLEKIWDQRAGRRLRAVLRRGRQPDRPAAPSHRGPSEVRGTLGEPSRFGTLARRVFQPLLRREDRRDAARDRSPSSTSAARCRPAPPCWRPAPAPGKTYTIAALAARYVAEDASSSTS